MLNGSLQGKRYPVVRVTIDEDRVRSFAHAVDHRGPGIPPTILTVPEIEAGLRNVLADPELGVDLARVLHGEQSYEWSRPLALGETLMAEATIESIRGRGALQFLSLRTDVRDERGDPVAVARSTLLIRGEA
ncbi:MAG TPA: MaoC family dehydratase N-terminal domain-containing protein [Actinomycetota bacterium]|nr:MaoC family dehydratase N-terminal domain-containing protein [Actinomycetota bacterium]